LSEIHPGSGFRNQRVKNIESRIRNTEGALIFVLKAYSRFGRTLTADVTAFTRQNNLLFGVSRLEGKTEHPTFKKNDSYDFKNTLVVIETITADFLLCFCEEIAL
jgi:hypothetical protein